jgi:RHS repeat-associated protein
VNKVDLNGDLAYGGTDELNDTRTHNVVNELTARDKDSDSSDDYTLTYDANGNMTDDGKDYTYEYDAFNRLRKIRNRANSNLLAEYRYNGLGRRIGIHEDTDASGLVDSSDKWFYDAFDERWRVIARYRESDSNPKEDFVPHQAGLDGHGDSSYIDLVTCRNKDANTAWTSASDGTLEERLYYCQNWRADVSVIVTSNGTMKEWVKYSAYGIPFGLPGGDANSDGTTDTADQTQVQSWINNSNYDVRGDIDLNGTVDAADKSTIRNDFVGIVMGRGILSSTVVSNRKGLTAYEASVSAATLYHVRHRALLAHIGRWLTRDELGYLDGVGLYQMVKSTPLILEDPQGLISWKWVITGTSTAGNDGYSVGLGGTDINGEQTQGHGSPIPAGSGACGGCHNSGLHGKARLKVFKDGHSVTDCPDGPECVGWHGHPDSREHPNPGSTWGNDGSSTGDDGNMSLNYGHNASEATVNIDLPPNPTGSTHEFHTDAVSAPGTTGATGGTTSISITASCGTCWDDLMIDYQILDLR